MTGKASGYNSRALTSPKTGKVAKGRLPVAPAPVVSGTMVVGSTLTATRGSWAPASAKLTNQWFRDGVAIPKATGSTYRLTNADLGTVVRVRVRGTRKGYLNTYAWSAALEPVSPVTPPTTSGTSTPTSTPSPTPTPTPSPTPTPTPTPTG